VQDGRRVAGEHGRCGPFTALAGQGRHHHRRRGQHAVPDEIGRVMLFLASDESSFITGATVAVDGGMSI
jgi:NAD(P)-dependent dehydrogenase (short-subunit alcohol dehydrogenase family)